MPRYAHLHGFSSSANSSKGLELRRRFAERGLELELPDLNHPSFAELTFTTALEALDAMHARTGGDAGEPWCLSGSSMGGYMAARWAELHPGRVERLLLLCPAFALVDRWPALLGEDSMTKWEREGSFPLPDGMGQLQPVHWKLIEDARTHPKVPEPSVPIRIIHGRQDVVIPIASSQGFVARHPEVQLIEVDDDHVLARSMDTIAGQAFEFYGL